MTRFLLIRHGRHSLLNHKLAGRMKGVSLSEEGVAQAEQLAERLEKLPIAALYSSPMERALETAAPLAARLQLPIEQIEAFNELDFGEWTGRAFDELHPLKQWQHFNQYRSGTRMPGGETMLEVQVRALSGMEELRARHGSSLVAVFTHGDIIRALIGYYLGTPLDLFRRLEISPASASLVELEDWGPRVLWVNYGSFEF